MDNAEEILQSLEEFSKLKPKEIPKELDDYLGYVAKTGDPVYQWHLIKCLFHEKLANVITEFYETSPSVDLPPCPNVDPFNYERMKTSLLERLDTFSSAPFTVQRICELLTGPRKQYNRVDKFMRAVEKNILVVSTREPGIGKRPECDLPETTAAVMNVNGVPEVVKDRDDEMPLSSDRVCEETPSGILATAATNGDESTMMSGPALTCMPHVPVENAVNAACVIQEEIEIAAANTGSSTAAAGREDRCWMNRGNIKMVLDRAATSDEADRSDTIEKTDEDISEASISFNNDIGMAAVEEGNVSKADVVTTTAEDIVKAPSIQFIESKEASSTDSTELAPADDQNETAEVSSTPDSPDSPEPSTEEVLCEASSEEGGASPSKSSTSSKDVDFQIIEEDEEDSLQCSKVDSEKKPEAVKEDEEVMQPDTVSNSENIVAASSSTVEPGQAITTSTEEQFSPERTVPDSSNDCFSADDNFVTEGTGENIIVQQPEESSAVSEGENSVGSITSSQAPDDEIVTGSIDELSDEKSIEVTESVPSNSVSAEAERVSIEEVTDNNVRGDVEEGPTVSTERHLKVFDEPVVEEEEEERREGGSVIHTTSSASRIEQEAVEIEPEPEVEEEAEETGSSQEKEVLQSREAVVVVAEEEISVDRSSCGSEEEEEAMDVDENSSSQQMTLSESEMTEDAEPMDQSEQPQS